MAQLPSARVVREAGRDIAAPRPTLDEVALSFKPLVERARQGLAIAIGLWPLTAIVAVTAGLLWAVGIANSP